MCARSCSSPAPSPPAVCTYHRHTAALAPDPHPLCRLAASTLRIREARGDSDWPTLTRICPGSFKDQAGAGPGVTVSPTHKGKVTLGAPRDRPGRCRPASRTLTIAYPLDGDRFLLEPRAESLAIPLKAISRAPQVGHLFRGRPGGGHPRAAL